MIEEFVEALNRLQFDEERAPETIKKNRSTLCEVVHDHTNAAIVSIWLAYGTPTATRFYCYYSSASWADGIRSGDRQLEVQGHDPTDEQVDKLLRDHMQHIAPTIRGGSVANFPVRNIFYKKGRGPSRNLGWLSIASAPDDSQPTEPRLVSIVGNTAAIVLAHQIDRSRISRVRAGHDALRRALREKPRVEDKLKVTADFLKELYGFRYAAIWNGRGNLQYLSHGANARAAPSKSALERIYLALPREASEPVIPLSLSEHLVDVDAKARVNSLVLHVRVPGFTAKDEPFRPAWTVEAHLDPTPAPYATILLAQRSDPIFFGDLGPSEIELSTRVHQTLEGRIVDNQYESSVSTLHDHLSQMDPSQPLDLDEVLELAKMISPNVSALTYLKPAPLDDRLEPINSTHPTPLPRPYLQRLQSTFQKYLSEQNGKTPDEARIGFAAADDQHFLEFHLSNTFEPVRLFIFQLDQPYITKDELRLFKYLITEMALRLRNSDSAHERRTLFAQIRHAIIDPIAAASNSLILIRSESRHARRNQDLWSALRNDELFHESIEKSLFLVNQAKMLAETGRYLFSNLRSTDLKTNHYDIVFLIRQVLVTFAHSMKVKRIVPKFVVTGAKPSILTGDELLIWVALTNLLDNAIKYGRSNSTIELTVNFFSNRYRFTITNEGPYLPPELKDRLFTPYVRGPQSDVLNKKHGTGIGLPVAAMILAAHSPISQLSYRSTKTSGVFASTTFSFELPYLIGRSSREQ